MELNNYSSRVHKIDEEQTRIEKCSSCSRKSDVYYVYRFDGNFIYLCENCHNVRREHFRDRCHICGRKLRKKSIYPVRQGNIIYLLCKDCWALLNSSDDI